MGEVEVPEAGEEEGPPEPTFSEQLLALLNSHPEGMKLVEMENALGVARIRVATESRRLIVEGKIKKEGPLYILVQ